jgi:Nucleoside H+ symporter
MVCIRGAAQGLIAFILWGVGNFVGSTLAGRSQAAHTLAEKRGLSEHDWHGIWIYPAWGAAAVLVMFVIFFRNPARASSAAALE